MLAGWLPGIVVHSDARLPWTGDIWVTVAADQHRGGIIGSHFPVCAGTGCLAGCTALHKWTSWYRVHVHARRLDGRTNPCNRPCVGGLRPWSVYPSPVSILWCSQSGDDRKGRFSQIWLQDKYESNFLKKSFLYFWLNSFNHVLEIWRFLFLKKFRIMVIENIKKHLILAL
jgi:hypothetical protein